MSRVVGDVLRQRAQDEPGKPFLKCGGEWLTYADFDLASDRLAAGLAELGVTKGDRVAYVVPNRQEMLELFFACMKLGAISVTLNYWLKGEFLRHQLADSGAETLVVDALGLATAAPLLPHTAVTRTILLDPEEQTRADLIPGAVLSVSELASSGGAAPDVRIAQREPLSIIYTSGTTGLPKGCLLPHGYYTAAGEVLGRAWLNEPGDRIHTAVPLYHATGQSITLMMALMQGESVCYEQSFSASQFIARASEEHATVAFGVGPMGMAILAQPPGEADTSHDLRLAIWPPMPVEKQIQFEERFGVSVIAEAFGQTECQPILISALGETRDRASSGRPAPHLQVDLLDDEDSPVGVGEVGEIVVRPLGPDLMFSGYWGQPEATLESWRNLWHHTGDFGRREQDGLMTFVDRKRDALRRRGENVSSFELEAAIERHPNVLRAAVVPVPSPLGESDIKVCIVCQDGQTPEIETLFQFFKASLPYFAVPRYVQFRSELPVTQATNRVMKHILRDEGVTEDTFDLEVLQLVVAKEERRRA
jgi:crotonobetaine/carnitine-CoA ligase